MRPGSARHHDDPIGQEQGLLDVVSDEKHRAAIGHPYLLQPFLHRAARDRISTPNGSSSRSTGRGTRNVRKSATRWRMPPDKDEGQALA